MTPARPVLRYHGSKWRLAQWIMSFFPPHKVYVEPFGGGGSVLLRKKPVEQEIYNDLDREIVNVFRVLRDPAQAADLQRLLYYTPHSREEYELSHQLTDDPVEAARRTITRSFLGYASNAVTSQYKNGFRSKRAGSAGPAREWATYPGHVDSFVARLRTVTLECAPALDLIGKYDAPAALFYVDPPYLRETRTAHGRSYRYEMTREEHVELARVLHSLRGMVILSGYDSGLYQDLYGDWHAERKDTQADGSVTRTEVLWVNPHARLANRPGLFEMVTL